MKTKLFAAGGVALAIALAVGGTAKRSARARVAVDGGEIALTMLGRAIVGSADGPATVRVEVDGRVTRVLAKVGDAVRAGDVLGELDASTLEIEVARRNAEARALSSSKLAIAEGARPEERAMAEAELAAARADLALADRRVKRIAALVTSGSVPEAEAEQEANARALAAARVARAEARLRMDKSGGRTAEIVSAQARVDAAEAALRQASADLARTKIVAPIDGVIVARRINVGDTVRVAAPAFEIANVDRVEVRVEIGEDEDGVLAPGVPARLVRGNGHVIARGRVKRVAAQLEGRTIGFDDARLRGDARVRVGWVELDEPPKGASRPQLLVGQVLEAELELGTRRVAARLPRDAVKVRDGRTVVDVPWGPFERVVPVKVGIADATYVETIGLAPGTQVFAR